MGSGTCDYVASKSDQKSWHGADSSTFHLDRAPEQGGLGITKWRCPHPPLNHTDGDDAVEDRFCVFHTDPADLPDDVDEREELLDAIEDAGEGPSADRPEHRGQFVGATFGALDLSGVTIAASEQHDIRFDHARFRADATDLNFRKARFVTEGRHPVSFVGTEFVATGEGDVVFSDASFQSLGAGSVHFQQASFRADGEGYVRFDGSMFLAAGTGDVSFRFATFRTSDAGKGAVGFDDAVFRTEGTESAGEAGNLEFGGATFRADGEGNVDFPDATFRTESDGDLDFVGSTFRAAGPGRGAVWFDAATFRTTAEGEVRFVGATFRAEDENQGEGVVWFNDATFHAEGVGDVAFDRASFRVDGPAQGGLWFNGATFHAEGDGDVVFKSVTFRAVGEGYRRFEDARILDADFRRVDLADADFGGADFTGADLREATLLDISLNGGTTCDRLYEGYAADGTSGRVSVSSRFQRLLGGSAFEPEEWDATARAYHQLKTVFSDHGLVGNARKMHVLERRARSLEARAENGWFDRRHLRSLLSRVFTGYGVQVRNLAFWMTVLFLVSTVVYVFVGVEETLLNNVAYSVLAFTVAPPRIPSGTVVKLVMMVETFVGTLSIVLLGYILGNRERF